jgi:hypothetical protein
MFKPIFRSITGDGPVRGSVVSRRHGLADIILKASQQRAFMVTGGPHEAMELMEYCKADGIMLRVGGDWDRPVR